ncbi:MAG: hypothetical protein K0V04_17030 [Deltaproteobacteria bacterium]|nr:hypothetical protein [Deltaproteobacteria bacterium]
MAIAFGRVRKAAKKCLKRETQTEWSALIRAALHSDHAIAQAALAQKEDCTRSLSLMLETIASTPDALERDPMLRATGLAEHILPSACQLDFFTTIALVRDDDQTIELLRTAWLEPVTPTEFTKVTTISRAFFSTCLAIRQHDDHAADLALTRAVEHLDVETAIDDFGDDGDQVRPPNELEVALRALLGGDESTLQAAVDDLWQAKLDLIREEDWHVLSLHRGSILGETMAMLAALAGSRGIRIRLPLGPRYWL